MRTSETDRLVLQERDRIVAYLTRERRDLLANGINHGRHLPRIPLEPSDDEHAVYTERAQAARYLRHFHMDKLASEVGAGKHVSDGG